MSRVSVKAYLLICDAKDVSFLQRLTDELFYRIINGLTNGGMRYGTAILLLAMYEEAVRERLHGEG